MDFFNISFWQGFVGNLFATIIGIALGIPVAFWINRWIESRTTKEKVEKIIKLLRDELSHNEVTLGRLDGELPRVVHEAGNISAQLRVELWKVYSDGGELQWLKDHVLIYMLAETYFSIRAVMTLADRAYEFSQHGEHGNPLPQTVEDTLMKAIHSANYLVKATIRKINDTLKYQ
jgi:hypothetical protein